MNFEILGNQNPKCPVIILINGISTLATANTDKISKIICNIAIVYSDFITGVRSEIPLALKASIWK